MACAGSWLLWTPGAAGVLLCSRLAARVGFMICRLLLCWRGFVSSRDFFLNFLTCPSSPSDPPDCMMRLSTLKHVILTIWRFCNQRGRLSSTSSHPLRDNTCACFLCLPRPAFSSAIAAAFASAIAAAFASATAAPAASARPAAAATAARARAAASSGRRWGAYRQSRRGVARAARDARLSAGHACGGGGPHPGSLRAG